MFRHNVYLTKAEVAMFVTALNDLLSNTKMGDRRMTRLRDRLADALAHNSIGKDVAVRLTNREDRSLGSLWRHYHDMVRGV